MIKRNIYIYLGQRLAILRGLIMAVHRTARVQSWHKTGQIWRRIWRKKLVSAEPVEQFFSTLSDRIDGSNSNDSRVSIDHIGSSQNNRRKLTVIRVTGRQSRKSSYCSVSSDSSGSSARSDSKLLHWTIFVMPKFYYQELMLSQFITNIMHRERVCK